MNKKFLKDLSEEIIEEKINENTIIVEEMDIIMIKYILKIKKILF